MSRALAPYVLPEGNVQIAFSGGRTSAYMLRQILDANGPLPERVRVIFTNTGRERPATLDFVAECESRWRVPITWLEYRHDNGPRAALVERATASLNAEPFETLLARKRYLPNQQSRFCTEELKVKTAKRWLVAQGWKKWTKAAGIRADEPHRHNPNPQPRETIWHPLVAAGVTKPDVLAFWRVQPFDLKAKSSNCRKCFLKSEADIAAEIRDEPADDWPDRMEERYGGTFSKRYSHAEMRRFVERQGDWLFSTEGALCQKDEGECM